MKPEKKKEIKRRKKKEINQERQWLSEPLQLLFGLVIMAYIFIPTFTPNWMSLDTNTPKFFTTALLNFFVFLILISTNYFKKNPGYLKGFFTANIGMIYVAFLLVSLLSFTQSVNFLESVLQFTKVFTVFAAVFNLSVILMHNLKLAKVAILVMTGLLIFDAVSVFYFINKFIEGDIARIADIKTVYSNKNILASSIYVKLPFAIWLMVFEKNWLKRLGWVALTFGIAATFFMATRAFYLGLIVISVIFIGYNVIHYVRKKQKSTVALAGSYVAALAIALMAFSFTQQFLYPKTSKGRHTQSVGKQVASIGEFDTSTGLRIDAWRWSWELIKENPVLGVGSGNWKVAVLKYENQKNPGFIYLYKTHNDFIETTAETGLLGGLLYIGIFAFLILNFLRHYIHKKDDPDGIHPYLFLSAAGIVFYSVDAFFNFPADRPEILALFAFFVSTGIAAYYRQKAANSVSVPDTEGYKTYNSIFHTAVSAVFILLLAGSVYILYHNFQSSKTQRIVYQEIMAGNLREPSGKIIEGFPFIPNVSIWGEPIGTLKARYLIEEGKNEEAIEVLRHDHSSPWDARREFFMAMAFNDLRQYDSALYYSEIAAQLKPNYFRNLHLAATLLERKGEDELAADYYENFLDKNKKDNQAWLLASTFYIKSGDHQKAYELITEAAQYHRRDTLIQKQKRFLEHKLFVEPYADIYQTGVQHYQNKRYRQAINQLDEYLEKVPEDANALQLRSFAHYYLNDHEKSIADADRSLEINPTNASLINLRGVCYRNLDNMDAACDNFRKSMEMGNASGKTNYERFCADK